MADIDEMARVKFDELKARRDDILAKSSVLRKERDEIKNTGSGEVLSA